MREPKLRILIFDENQIRASILKEGLAEAGCAEIAIVSELQGLTAQVRALDPDVIFMDLQSPNRDTLEAALEVSRAVARPVAVFVDESDPAMTEAAVDAGVSAYIVDGLKKERVKAILDVTISRFNAFNRLRDELASVKSELADRRTIDRAKLHLMRSRNLTEGQAYALLRRTAMSNNCRIVDVARSILIVADLADGNGKQP
ncbi:MAG: ANTAR domain-containing protein [Alphaproteobacteria bacterium]|nr:ANTAR domain-containing protein [Alphaproteobacteria bacterium]